MSQYVKNLRKKSGSSLPRRIDDLTAWLAPKVTDDRRFDVKSRHSLTDASALQTRLTSLSSPRQMAAASAAAHLSRRP